MIHTPDLPWFLPLLLYAETHYRFRYFFSYLEKREPELIADAPHRIEPGQQVPLLVLAKDAHQYPARLRQIHVQVKQNDQVLSERELLKAAIELNRRFWWQTFLLDLSSHQGWVSISVSMELECNGKARTYTSDNHRTSSHRPLKVYLAEEPLPGFEYFHFGDPHTHSNYTDDQVEFGAPLAASRQQCRAMGLSFYCVTDHSYDLDDEVDNYLSNDSGWPKWSALKREVEELNRDASDFAIVRGEEVSCRNSAGRNVHLLLLGNGEFFKGSGDGAEKWFHTRSEHVVSEILLKKEKSSVAFAAHPKEHVPVLQRLLLARGEWQEADLERDNLDGWQIANGCRDKGFREGYRTWINNLLAGRRHFILAGNDAHGNFNRFRQIGIPFFKVREWDRQVFGKMRTGVIVKDRLTEESILQALKNGRSVITDGPVIRLEIMNEKNGIAEPGEEIRGRDHLIRIEAKTTKEFGALSRVAVYWGVIGQKSEQPLLDLRDLNRFEFQHEINLMTGGQAYVRAEAYTTGSNGSDNALHFCLTNPIWISLT